MADTSPRHRRPMRIVALRTPLRAAGPEAEHRGGGAVRVRLPEGKEYEVVVLRR